MTTPRVWLITGCSSGFGRELVQAALNHGDKVIATARNPAKIEDLVQLGAHTLELDVTSSPSELRQRIEEAIKVYGKIDVLVNNAAYVLQGGIEEASSEETFDQFNTNVFGLLNVTRAVLPEMRSRKSGTIVNIGSIGGWRGTPGVGLYCATKFALAGISEALQAETKHLGIDVMLVEPGYFRTSLLRGGNSTSASAHITDYDESIGPIRKALSDINNKQPGDPKKGAQVIIDVVTQSGAAKGRGIPVRLALGSDAPVEIENKCNSTLEQLELWREISSSTDHDDVA
ncbi:hypothetical protein K7432_008806 [Basidiobolus ranarum]|uniref:Uncharacterized protein n=1 Tax=Basidiobolus ranarum TaxID=34480 RepID=A0ABR2WR99_9FUNG